MCFSAEADIAGGVIVGVIGIDAVRHVEHKRELALAALPLVFAAHQLTEAFVWWGLTDRVPWRVGVAAAWLFLVVAFSVLPILVPLAIRAVEPDRARRTLMTGCTGVGLVVAVVYLMALVAHPVGAEIDGHRIVYFNRIGEHGLLNGLYVLATCGPMLASTHRRIVAFGIVNLAALALLLWVESNAKTSLWCAWAAMTSVAIAAHLRFAHGARGQPPAVPARPVADGDRRRFVSVRRTH